MTSGAARALLAVPLVALAAATAFHWNGSAPRPGVAPADAATEAKLRWFGYNEDWLSHPGKVNRVARGGANALRSVVSWRTVERRRSEYRWHPYDALYERMLAAGARPLWVLADAPCWAWADSKRECREQGKVAHPPDPEHFREWAGFAAQLVSRYPESVAIESWNEPNLASYFRPEPDPVLAAYLAAWANFGVDQVDASIPVIFGGTSPTFHSIPGRQIAYEEFLRAAYRAAGPGHWDGLAMHPFPSMRKQGHYLRDIHAHLNTARAITRSAGAPKTPIWVTEVGLSTRGIRPYAETEQATGLRRIYRGLSRRRDVTIPAIVVHRLVDQRAGFGAPAEAGWGVLRRGGRAKRAFCTLAKVRGSRCPPHGKGRKPS